MLDAPELKRRLINAMDDATPPVSSARLAEACKVSAQAVHGWRKTGRIAKGRLTKIAEVTGKPLEYFLGDEGGIVSHGMKLGLEEAEAIKRLRDAAPQWRNYVLGLAMIDKSAQDLMLKTMQQTVPNYKVERAYGDAPHVAEAKRKKAREKG